MLENSKQFTAKFRELARKYDLPVARRTFLRRAESVLESRLEEARELVNSRREAGADLAAILRQARRAKLFLQLKIFKVDRIFERLVARRRAQTFRG